MYGNQTYGLLKYAIDSPIDEEEISKYYIDLTRYVPEFLAALKELSKIYNIEGRELGLLRYYLDELLKQSFIQTATWGLLYWEQEYKITTNLSLSYEQRREILLAKKKGQGTSTKKMIKSVAETFSGGQVDVREDNANSLFIVKFIGIKGIPQNMQAFIEMLEDIKPAHLTYRFEYTYSVWDNFKNQKWDDLSMITWDDMRVI